MSAIPSVPTWRVLIHFEETKVRYLAHVPTEEQKRGYHKDRLYRHPHPYDLPQLQLFVVAATVDEAKAKARQLLLEYVQKEPA